MLSYFSQITIPLSLMIAFIRDKQYKEYFIIYLKIKLFKKLNKPYGEFKREIMQIKSLNVGEDKSMHCYRTMSNDTSGFCKKVFEYEIDKYHKTKKYK